MGQVHVIVQAKDDSTCRLRVDGDVELHSRTPATDSAVSGVDVELLCTDADIRDKYGQTAKMRRGRVARQRSEDGVGEWMSDSD
jgi:hypothetical protein